MMNPGALKKFLMMWLFPLLIASGCGTMAGNPKKPDDDDTQKIDLVDYRLPEIDFEIPAELSSDAELNLVQGADRTILRSWSKRIDKSLLDLNRFNQRINSIIEKLEENGVAPTVEGDISVLRFDKEGFNGSLSAKISLNTVTKYGDATLCVEGVPVKTMSWSDEGKSIEMIRSFEKKSFDSEVATAGLVKATVLVGESTAVDVTWQGFAESVAAGTEETEGVGRIEHSTAERLADGSTQFRNVVDWFSEFPSDDQFEGDTYLVGRTIPNQQGEIESEFIGFSKSLKILCKNGFDEGSETLWEPVLGEPRWCLGRPLGEKKFSDWDHFLQTVKGLEAVGINKASDLKRVSLDPAKTCD